MSQRTWAETQLVLEFSSLRSAGKFGTKKMGSSGHPQGCCCRYLGMWESDKVLGSSRLHWHWSLGGSELRP